MEKLRNDQVDSLPLAEAFLKRAEADLAVLEAKGPVEKAKAILQRCKANVELARIYESEKGTSLNTSSVLGSTSAPLNESGSTSSSAAPNISDIEILQSDGAQPDRDWDIENPSMIRVATPMANSTPNARKPRCKKSRPAEDFTVLNILTTEIKSIFCHNSMVDRIAAMLNYFLLHLVGPRKERFKVKDKKEFDFEPAQTVLEISHIYINLSTDDSFCLAVSQDGRSYSDQLFGFAENILIRIGGGQLIGDMSEFAAKVKKMGDQYKEEQELLADAPEEYLDPIISSLMTDPVILPSSKVTVDRSTIARHLLSDQTDPFNREPLTMDKVKSNEALKLKIDQWIEGKRSAARSKS
ncbi:ubiquitin conjugation factor E4 A [Drosophila persimilis]|uniref:ubiquitin conjugation factor E4 A n=1 Tax=Drosophila persimilis TaxID=7234 RepID=UPI000F07AC62|nr:ubiquitin conjugation factor E4 A [Drosophila persimilis]